MKRQLLFLSIIFIAVIAFAQLTSAAEWQKITKTLPAFCGGSIDCGEKKCENEPNILQAEFSISAFDVVYDFSYECTHDDTRCKTSGGNCKSDLGYLKNGQPASKGILFTESNTLTATCYRCEYGEIYCHTAVAGTCTVSFSKKSYGSCDGYCKVVRGNNSIGMMKNGICVCECANGYKVEINIVDGNYVYECVKDEEKPTCGNNKLESGETQISCCKDAGCPTEYGCLNNKCEKCENYCQKTHSSDTTWSGGLKPTDEKLKYTKNLQEEDACWCYQKQCPESEHTVFSSNSDKCICEVGYKIGLRDAEFGEIECKLPEKSAVIFRQKGNWLDWFSFYVSQAKSLILFFRSHGCKNTRIIEFDKATERSEVAEYLAKHPEVEEIAYVGHSPIIIQIDLVTEVRQIVEDEYKKKGLTPTEAFNAAGKRFKDNLNLKQVLIYSCNSFDEENPGLIADQFVASGGTYWGYPGMFRTIYHSLSKYVKPA